MPTSRSNKRIIGITLGDPGGIGPEVILKSFEATAIKRHLKQGRGSNVFFVCVGSLDVLSKLKTKIKAKVPLHSVSDAGAIRRGELKKNCLNVLDIAHQGAKFATGKVAKGNGELALEAIQVAGFLAKEKAFDAIVTAPVNKEACQKTETRFLGHTDVLAAIDETDKYAMMLSGGPLRVVLVTVHVPLRKVSLMLHKQAIVEKIELTHTFAKNFLKMKKARIGVAGINPHAGEGGSIGLEEKKVIGPAIQAARKKGINVTGPHSPDVIFHKAYREELDFVVAMYHDQGLGPLKMIAFDEGINTTLGLSFIRTSPDHGTAFDIAGKNKANPESMINAILSAVAWSQKGKR